MTRKIFFFTLLLFFSFSGFSQDQTISWATFFGGSGFDRVHTVKSNNEGEIFFVGYTSSDDLPITENAFQEAGNGSQLFIGKLDSNKQIEYLTYFGFGDFSDIDLQLLNNGGYVISGCIGNYATSPDLPITDNAFQPTIGGGEIDGFVCVFSEDHQLTLSSFIGGENNDFIYGLAVDEENNIFISGETNSPGLATPGAQKETIEGIDGFVMKISSVGEVLWRSYYGGENYDSFGKNSIQITSSGNLYIGGITNSVLNIATDNGAFPEPGGEWDLMLFKLNSENGEVQWSTYIGGEGDEYISVHLVLDENENIYVSSSTYSTTRINFNFNSSYQGEQDAFIMAFNSAGEVLWGRYFGGPEPEVSSGLKILNNILTIYGTTHSNNGIVFGNPLHDEINFIGQFLSQFSMQTGNQLSGTYLFPNDFLTSYLSDLHNSIAYIVGILGESEILSPYITPNALQPTKNGGWEGFMMGVQINVTASLPTVEKGNVSLYPNPSANRIISIELPDKIYESVDLEIYDQMGRCVFIKQHYISSTPLSLENLGRGFYLVKVKSGNAEYSQKLVLE